MTKVSFILPVFLFLFCNLFGQTDTNTSPSKDTARDSNLIRTAPPVRRDSPGSAGDSGVVRKPVRKKILTDSAAGRAALTAGGRLRDSLARVRLRDSLGRTGAGDSLAQGRRMDSLAGRASAHKAPGRNYPDGITLYRSALAANGWFPFLSKPVATIYEIHRTHSRDSLFYLLLGILFYFALIRIFFEKYFNNLLTLFFRVSLRQQQIREQVLQTPLPSLLLNGLFVFSAGLFACNLLYQTPFGHSINFWILYLDCMAVLAVVYLGKFLILKFCGWVFNISRATDIYIFVVFLVNKILGIFLLPFLILITFSGPGLRDIVVTISFAMIFVLLMYRVFASYRPIRNEIKLTIFSFLLYLCAFEIAPLLLIYKVLFTYLGKPY